jgi:multiple sugar transport system substrate-binding protein
MRHPRTAALMAIALLSVTVTACGSSGGTASDHEITLIMSNHPWQRAIGPHLAEFEKETGITVKVQTFAEQQMRDKVQLTLRSRSRALDVYMTLPSREGPQFARAAYYQPLDSYLAAAPANYKKEDFTEGAFGGMKINTKTIALPINVEGTALFYRTDLFTKYGIEPPKTLDDLESVSKTIKAKGEVTPIALRGMSTALPFTFAPFLHSLGGAWTTGPRTPSVNTPQGIEAIRRYATLAKDYGPPGVINNTFTQSSALMAQGKVAMELESSNELSSIMGKDSTITDKLGVAPFPSGSAGSVPTVLSWGIAMSPYSKNKPDAWAFMQWATSPTIQLELTKAGIAPPRTSVLEDPAYTTTLASPAEKQWLAVIKEIQDHGNPEVGPVGLKAPAMRQVVGDAVGKAILGTSSPEQAAAAMQKSLMPSLAENNR